jgi:hypothetical protein
MNPDTLRLNALVQHAKQLPDAALPHLGDLAHLGLWLSGISRRRFFRGVASIFGCGAADHRKGMLMLLRIPELDHDLACHAVQEANRLRRAVSLMERENVQKFFRALRKATLLRDYFLLILDVFESEGEDVLWSIFDGTAFREGGLAFRLAENLGSCLPGSRSEIRADSNQGGVQERPLPTYDRAARELRVGLSLLRRYCRFNYHEDILMAFQAVGWCCRIPIPQQFSEYPERLQETIDQLNTPQKGKPMLLRFRLHGGSVVWEWQHG